jgi:sugar phosphate isomerase/epimerase
MTTAPTSHAAVRLGIDVYSLRSQQWDAFQVLDYCHALGIQVVHFSEIKLLGGLDTSHLLAVRRRASELNLDLEIGMRSFCPTSNLFDASQGTPQEQLSRMIVAAETIGSPLVRAFVGNAADRRGAVPFAQSLKNAVGVLHSVRSQALASGIKIAVENHSGDMQAPELKWLIEQAGPDFVGACLDSGNPLITLEDPHLSLEILAPYVLTSHVRDTVVWLTPEGAAAAWVRMGEGNVGISEYVRKYLVMCPGRALSLEIIVSPQPRPFPFREPGFWDAYRSVPAWQFVRFLQLAEKGAPARFRPLLPGESSVDREREDLESSLVFTKDLLRAVSSRQEISTNA